LGKKKSPPGGRGSTGDKKLISRQNFDTELEDPFTCTQKGWRIPTRRRGILSLFGSAQSTDLSSGDDLSRLIDKKPALLDFVLHRGQMPTIGLQQPRLWEWLAKIREGDGCRSTFHFPDNKAGPDICFALRNQESTDCILCVIQVSSISYQVVEAWPMCYGLYRYQNRLILIQRNNHYYDLMLIIITAENRQSG
jgi:hypothetical protein